MHRFIQYNVHIYYWFYFSTMVKKKTNKLGRYKYPKLSENLMSYVNNLVYCCVALAICVIGIKFPYFFPFSLFTEEKKFLFSHLKL